MIRLLKTPMLAALAAAWLVAGPGGTGIAVASRCRAAHMAMARHPSSGPCFCGSMSVALAGTVTDAAPGARVVAVTAAAPRRTAPPRTAAARPRSHSPTPPTPPPLAPSPA